MVRTLVDCAALIHPTLISPLPTPRSDVRDRQLVVDLRQRKCAVDARERDAVGERGLDSLGSGSQLGFGANWGRSNDALFGADLDDQYAIEAYYRLQLSRELAITPSVQLLIDPAVNPDEDRIWVAGVRARLAF